MPAARRKTSATDARPGKAARRPSASATASTADLADARMREYFLGWQCRIRQMAMRQYGGRPTPGMAAKVYLPSGDVVVEAMTIVLVPLQPEESTAFLKFNVQKSNDPRVVYEKGLTYLQSTYYQQPHLFDGDVTAVFGQGSAIAAAILKAPEVVLEFEEYGQTFRMIARACRLKAKDPALEATLWHNRTFNPAIPNSAEVLSFAIEWRSAQAHPEPL